MNCFLIYSLFLLHFVEGEQALLFFILFCLIFCEIVP